MNKSKKFSAEVRERAVRMVQEHRGEYSSQWASRLKMLRIKLLNCRSYRYVCGSCWGVFYPLQKRPKLIPDV